MLPILYKHGQLIGRCDKICITQHGVFIYFVLDNIYKFQKLSIGYKIISSSINNNIRIIHALIIYEISIVDSPAQKVDNYERISRDKYFKHI